MKQFHAAQKRINVSVGESVRIVRELQGLSQNQLAERSEMGEFKLEAPGGRRPKKAVKPADVEKAMKAFAPLNGGAP